MSRHFFPTQYQCAPANEHAKCCCWFLQSSVFHHVLPVALGASKDCTHYYKASNKYLYWMCTYRVVVFKEKAKSKEICSNPRFTHINQDPLHWHHSTYRKKVCKSGKLVALCSIRIQDSCTYYRMINIHLSDYDRCISIKKSYTKTYSCYPWMSFVPLCLIVSSSSLLASRSTTQVIFAFVSLCYNSKSGIFYSWAIYSSGKNRVITGGKPHICTNSRRKRNRFVSKYSIWWPKKKKTNQTSKLKKFTYLKPPGNLEPVLSFTSIMWDRGWYEIWG